MISIIMPAHNEAAVIARSLQMLVAHAEPGELDIIVVCNGCSDNTAEVARRFAPAVRVLETDVPSKTNALNIGDANARSFPRIYVDADVVLSLEAARALTERLMKGDVHVAAPSAVIDVRNCSKLVRAYYTVRGQLPSARQGIGGSGVYALSAAGRARFRTFPDITADDAFVRLQFSSTERTTISTVKSVVYAPRTVRSLLAIRTRVYYGIAELARRFPETRANADASNNRNLLRLFRYPPMWPAIAAYVTINTIARCRALSRSTRPSVGWVQDHTTRREVAQERGGA